MTDIYSTLMWRTGTRARAIERDGHRCTVSRLLGGECASGPLHAHHIVPVNEGGDAYDLDNVGTTCAAHHPMWEALRRILARRMMSADDVPRCRHEHRTAEARRICEARLRRQRALAA